MKFILPCITFLALFSFLCSDLLQAQTSQDSWNPKILFGTVNFNDQLADHPDEWKRTAEVVDGMLLHVHFFVRRLNTPENKPVPNVDETARKLAPVLLHKNNIIELTYDLKNEPSPEQIAQRHAKEIKRIEKEIGILIAGINLDWILNQIDIQWDQTPRSGGTSDIKHSVQVLENIFKDSALYVQTLRQNGCNQPIYAVFPPVYVQEGNWSGAGSHLHPGITLNAILKGLFDVGFDGFTADTPFSITNNPNYKKKGYIEALQVVQKICKSRSKAWGIILTNNNTKDGDEWDAQFERDCMDMLEIITRSHLTPDVLIVESWHKGPFKLVPETSPNSFTHTVLEIFSKLKP